MYKWLFLIVVVFLTVSATCLLVACKFRDVAKEIKDNKSILVALDQGSAGSEMKDKGENGMKSWIRTHKYSLEILQSFLSLFFSLTLFTFVLFVLTTLTAYGQAVAAFLQTDNLGMQAIDCLLTAIFCTSVSLFLYSLIVFHSGLVLLNPYGMDSFFMCLGIFAAFMLGNTYRVCRRPL